MSAMKTQREMKANSISAMKTQREMKANSISAMRTLAFLALIGVSSCQSSDCSYIGLLTHLNLTTTNDVLAVARPVKHWNTSTLVQLDMVLYGILQVDEKFQTITNHIFTEMRWMNEFLTWNPSDFCGIDVVTVPRSRLWIPDIYILEDVSDTGSMLRSSMVSLAASGLVVSNTRQRLSSTCRLNLNLFPFDTQICHITFSSMSLAASSMKLATFYQDSVLGEVSEKIMVTQGEWELDHMQIIKYNHTDQLQLIYKVTLSRRPMLYVINFIVPLFYFLVLDLASFFISEARGEKLGFKVTVLLSISVLLLILKDMLPSTENRLPMIAMYCVVIFALVGLSVLEAMLISFLLDLDAPHGSQKADRVEVHLEADYHKEPAGAEETPEKSEAALDDGDLLELILEEVKAARQEAERQDKDKRQPGRFRRRAQIIDSVFFVVYFLVVVAFLTYMMIKWISQLV